MLKIILISFILVGGRIECSENLSPHGEMKISESSTFHHGRTYSNACSVSLLHKTETACQRRRHLEVAKLKQFYKISEPDNAMPLPHLDQPLHDTMVYFMTEKFHAYWFNLYFNVLSKQLRNLVGPMVELKYKNAQFTTFQNYTQVHEDFRNLILKATFPLLDQYKFPSSSYEYFTSLTKDERFKSDRYFAEQRLAGLNPMVLRRVDWYGTRGTNWENLKKRLDFSRINWEAAITSVTGQDILLSVMQRQVYVAEFPLLKDIPAMKDLLANERPGMKMRAPCMPIAMFAVNREGQFKVVAIQNDTKPGATVFTPEDGIMWDLVKAQFQETDLFYGQVYEHLLRTHMRMEPICISMHRHLSSLHPIHQILKFHCRGLIPLNAQGKVTLLDAPQTVRSLFSRGNKGAIALLYKGFQTMKWNDIDLEENIKDRGMEDTKMLPYYPYRDDGRLVDKVLEKFTKKLINMYYRWDVDVRKDTEIQALAQELSSAGKTGPQAAYGRIQGLEPSFSKKSQLASFLKETLWIVVQHAMFSFPIAEYGSTTNNPTKLYEGKDAKFFDMLPGSVASVLQGSLTHGLGSLHYDEFFDYSEEITCERLRHLVRHAYDDMKHARDEIHERNRKRYQAGHLTNPFMLQEWMPNSIST
ncbi:allene oxide synthase-lipoxygenase protein-like [Rhopilema esculentum]|uniref:allene oxide synthase-lipoxygenase protein-like n=1 Tax=Rhopilema esculentum TaxID=499914 RepID=UPI0031CE48A5